MGLRCILTYVSNFDQSYFGYLLILFTLIFLMNIFVFLFLKNQFEKFGASFIYTLLGNLDCCQDDWIPIIRL
jgi:hypothetical protein